MTTSTIAVVVTSMDETFRRAGMGFTNKGTALARDGLAEGVLDKLHAESRLSVREMPEDKVPDGVDRIHLDNYIQSLTHKEQHQEQPAPAAEQEEAPETPPEKVTAPTKAPAKSQNKANARG
jgi:hypothetical protein